MEQPISKQNDCRIHISKHELESLARCLLPDIEAFFNSPEGKAEFAAWKAAQQENPKT